MICRRPVTIRERKQESRRWKERGRPAEVAKEQRQKRGRKKERRGGRTRVRTGVVRKFVRQRTIKTESADHYTIQPASCAPRCCQLAKIAYINRLALCDSLRFLLPSLPFSINLVLPRSFVSRESLACTSPLANSSSSLSRSTFETPT